MITGTVAFGREAEVTVQVAHKDGEVLNLAAIIDTGFTDHLTMSPDIVEMLGLPYRGTMQAVLADGSTVILPLHGCTVIWHGEARKIPVAAADGGSLVGMAMLYGSRVSLDVVDGGAVTIEPLEVVK